MAPGAAAATVLSRAGQGTSTGAGAGAGGARTTLAAAGAPLRELVIAVINSLAPSPLCAQALAELALVPPLIRALRVYPEVRRGRASRCRGL